MSTHESEPDPVTRALLMEHLAEMGGLSTLLSAAIAARAGINPTDLESLDLLRRHGPMTAGRIAERTGLTTGAITGVIDRLERRGYARREADPTDRRRVVVHAEVDVAERELGPHYASLAEAMTAIVNDYSDQELALILGAVQRFNEAMRASVAGHRDS